VTIREAFTKPLSHAPPTVRAEYHTRASVERGGERSKAADSIASAARKPNYSMTSSASASGVGGTVRPSAFAVLRFMHSSNLDAWHHRKLIGLFTFENSADI
jgi:hypothetical protein